jgi:hypothetical protein
MNAFILILVLAILSPLLRTPLSTGQFICFLPYPHITRKQSNVAPKLASSTAEQFLAVREE